MLSTKLVTHWLAAVFTASLSGAATAHGEDGDAAGIDYANAEEHPFGKAGDPDKVSRTIEIEMTDKMRFMPSEITVSQGETVRFLVKNGGGLVHEMVLGTRERLQEHAALMLEFPGMEHDEPHMAHVSRPAIPGRWVGSSRARASSSSAACSQAIRSSARIEIRSRSSCR